MTQTFQLNREQAQAYDDLFVPALFGQWAPQLVDCARVRHGQSVLDVACGTGVVARTARDVVGPGGRVVGVDLNPAMLEVTRETWPSLEWVQGDAEDLPFADAEFDVALCQSALSFFADPGRAVAEMARVVNPGGVVALQTYAPLTEQPAYGPFVDMVAEHAGPEARVLLSTYWSQGEIDDLRGLTLRPACRCWSHARASGRPSSRRRPPWPTRRSRPPRSPQRSHRRPMSWSSRAPRSCSANTPTSRASCASRSGPLLSQPPSDCRKRRHDNAACRRRLKTDPCRRRKSTPSADSRLDQVGTVRRTV